MYSNTRIYVVKRVSANLIRVLGSNYHTMHHTPVYFPFDIIVYSLF